MHLKYRETRTIYLDILRIIACLMVIFNHSNERGFLRFISDDMETALWWINLFFSTMCKSAVPIFFMISGALLLRKEETICATYRRIPRIFTDLVLFSLLYYWTDAISWGNSFYPILSTVFAEIGKCTFGVYLLHIWVLWRIPPLFNYWMKIEQSKVLGQYAVIYISCLLVFAIAGVCTYVLRKIPIVQKLF